MKPIADEPLPETADQLRPPLTDEVLVSRVKAYGKLFLETEIALKIRGYEVRINKHWTPRGADEEETGHIEVWRQL